MSSLSNAKIYLGGVAATYKDMADGAKYDLMIAVVSALTLIFMIMLILTRSAVAALVIVATAASSIAASFGISVLLWQDLFGIQVHWLVMLMSVIILLAVGSDYNLLLVSRFRDEIHAGLKTGIIRSMAGTGGVVTSAGLVFAATMAGMMFSKLTVLAQMGSTIAIGLLVDTLIVRSLLMPSIATHAGPVVLVAASRLPPGRLSVPETATQNAGSGRRRRRRCGDHSAARLAGIESRPATMTMWRGY